MLALSSTQASRVASRRSSDPGSQRMSAGRDRFTCAARACVLADCFAKIRQGRFDFGIVLVLEMNLSLLLIFVSG